MTNPTPRPTLSPEAADALRWIAAGRPRESRPQSYDNAGLWKIIVEELKGAGLIVEGSGAPLTAPFVATDAGREEAARLEEEANPQPARPAPASPPPSPVEPAFTIGGAIVGFIAQILMVPEGRKVAAGLIDSALDQFKRNREESRRVAEEAAAEKPAPATTERRAPKKGRRRRG